MHTIFIFFRTFVVNIGNNYLLTIKIEIQMEDLFKKFIYTGVGLVSLTAERLQKSVDSLVADQKLSKEEGRKIVDDVLRKTETKREEFEKQLKKVTEEVLENFNYPKAKEVEDLRKRVESLEIKLGKAKVKTEEAVKTAEAAEAKASKAEVAAAVKKGTKSTTKKS